jgi:hypothetical protein
MPSLRASTAPAWIAALIAAAVLTGCAASRLSSQPPPGVRLAGDWKLDTARSDDLGQAIARLRAQTRKARPGRGEPRSESANEPAAASHGRRGHEGGPGDDDGGETAESGTGPAPGGGTEGPVIPLPRVSAVDQLMSSVPRGEYLRITITANAFTVISGDSSDQYTPGLESYISAQQGDAQQISGWKDGAYVIDTKPQWGLEVTQSYALTKDGRLAMTVRLNGGRTKFLFTRVYDRTMRVAPLAPPTSN